MISDVAYPRQAMIVSCRGNIKSNLSPDIEEKDNLVTLSWHMPVSHDPELYAIALAKKRHSLKLILESKVFVVNFMPFSLKEDVLFVGRHSGENIDKFEETSLTKEEAESIDCCRIKQATGCLECEVVNNVDAGDHLIVIGKVIKTITKKGGKKIFQVKGDQFTTLK